MTVAEARLGIIIPAAGSSSRLGQPKQLLQVEGESLVRRSTRIASGLKPAELVLVTGAHHQQAAAEVGDLPVNVVHHPGWQSGMGGSIAAGARALVGDLDGIMVLLCDQWRLRRENLEQLLAFWQLDRALIAAACWNESYGPPVVFPATLLPGLRGLEGDRGARTLIEQSPDGRRFFDMPDARFDLDTPDDLQSLKESGMC